MIFFGLLYTLILICATRRAAAGKVLLNIVFLQNTVTHRISFLSLFIIFAFFLLEYLRVQFVNHGATVLFLKSSHYNHVFLELIIVNGNLIEPQHLLLNCIILFLFLLMVELCCSPRQVSQNILRKRWILSLLFHYIIMQTLIPLTLFTT